MLLLIDLILLKPRVYRHLVFNRGSAPYRATRKTRLGKSSGAVEVGEKGENGDDAAEEVDEEMRVTRLNLDRRNVSP